jgi:hypothetical protein
MTDALKELARWAGCEIVCLLFGEMALVQWIKGGSHEASAVPIGDWMTPVEMWCALITVISGNEPSNQTKEEIAFCLMLGLIPDPLAVRATPVPARLAFSQPSQSISQTLPRSRELRHHDRQTL